MIATFILVVFFTSLMLILTLAAYPFFAWLRYILFKSPVNYSDEFVKPVSIIIASYNEEKYIRQKLESFLNPDEWIEGSEIIIISTGSVDGTNTILDEYAEPGKVIVVKSHERISKIQAVNMAVAMSKNELLVFSDNRQSMKPGSVKKMIRNFNDPGVGTVVSRLEDQKLYGKTSIIRRVLNFSIWCDSQVDSGLNVHGALYAQRKTIFKPFPTHLLFDDLFCIVSTIAQKKRLVQEKDAVIYDVPFVSYYNSERIQRLARGLLIFLYNNYSLILKMPPLHLLRFLQFKFVKLALPFLLVVTLSAATYLYIIYFTPPLALISGFAILLSLVIPTFRRFIATNIKINYFFMIATIKFVLGNDRSNSWQQLHVSRQSDHQFSKK